MKRVAAWALALVTLVCAIAWSAPPTDSQQSQHRTANTRSRTAEAHGASEHSPLFIKVVPAAPDPNEDEKRATENKEKAEKIKIDQGMLSFTGNLAKSTEYLFWATAALFVVTAALFATSLRQLHEARSAIAAAVRSANVAEQSLRHNQKATAMQLRAYVLARPKTEGGFHVDDANIATVSLELVNHGQTPALLRYNYLELRIEPYPTKTIDWNTPDSPSNTPIGPGASVNQWHSITLNDATLTALNAKTHALYARSLIRYTDLFDKPHTSDQVFFVQGTELRSGNLYIWPHQDAAD